MLKKKNQLRQFYHLLFLSVTTQLMYPIEFHSRKKKIQWKSMRPLNCLVPDILQNIFFCVQQKIEIHTGLKQLEGE